MRIIVLAKAPVPGRVKTRLCPPCTPRSAARIAAAALTDTIATVESVPFVTRELVVEGTHPVPPGWRSTPQRGRSLGERIANAFAGPALLIGMDTPQVTAGQLDTAVRMLHDVDAVLGPAVDGGWWALGLRDPAHAAVIRDIPTSTRDTGARTGQALRAIGLRVGTLPTLRDVDTADDALDVAVRCPPESRFAAAVRSEVPS
jgi:uncharacterized protein